MNALLRLSTWLSRIALTVAGIALLAMMMVTVVDVVLRYAFTLSNGASGLVMIGSVELVSYLLMFALLAAMAAHVERSQVVVEVFTQTLPTTVKARVAGVYLLIFAVAGVVIALGIVDEAHSAAEFGEVTQDLALPKAPLYYVAVALFILFALRSAIHGLQGLIQGVSHDA